MTFTAQSPWRAIGDTTLAIYQSEFARKNSPLLPFAADIYKAVQGYSALYLAHLAMESEYATTGIAKTNPDWHNAVGTKVRGGNNQYQQFASWVDGAKEWKSRVLDPSYAYAPTTTIASYIHVYAPSSDGNNETNYVSVIVDYATRFAVVFTTPDTGGTPVTYSTVIPGLPGGPLTTLVPVNLKIVPASHTLQRPGIKAEAPRRSVQHGNGNPNSTAAGEATYLYNGADGRQASYHSAVDDTSIWFMIPADEVTWQAADGAGPGNMSGFSCEQVEDDALWANAARRDACIRNAADWMGRISARLGIAKPEQHWDFNFADPDRHDCPNKLRHTVINGRKAWDIYVDLWNAAKADELKLMGGQGTGHVTPPPTTYAKTSPIAALKDITVDKNNEAPGIVTDEGTDFVYVADVVEATKDTRRLQAADKNAKDVGPKLAKGERFIVTWLFKAKDGNYYYLTPWWTRVAKADTKRISDAPIVDAAA